MLARLTQRGDDVLVRHATGLVLDVDASTLKMPFSTELVKEAAAGAHGELFDRESAVNGRHDCEGWYVNSGDSIIDLRTTNMSSEDAIVAMIKETFGDVPDELFQIVGAALVEEMPSLASIVHQGDDACAAEDRPDLTHDEHVKRALHVLAMLGLEMRMSGQPTLQQYAAAGAFGSSAITAVNEITAVKDVVAEDSNERAVVTDYLRSFGVEATAVNVDKIRGLMVKIVTDPAAILDGLVGSSGIGEDVVEPVAGGSGPAAILDGLVGSSGIGEDVVEPVAGGSGPAVSQDLGAMATIKKRL